jgi:O-acetyl-ADP-ribose deacetylase
MFMNFKTNSTTAKLIKDDLSAMDVEAFVFYARKDLALGSGYGTAISTRGGPTIKSELEKIGGAKTTDAVISKAGQLKAKYIIHAVGPEFQEPDLQKKLWDTIENALKCADKNGIKQVAFPLMGTGFYGVPIDTCIKVMNEVMTKYLSGPTGINEIIICAKDNREYNAFSKMLESKS